MIESTPAMPQGGSFLNPSKDKYPTITNLEETDFLVQATNDFMRGVILPAASVGDGIHSDQMPGLLSKAGELGILGLEIPEIYGGLGLPKSAAARISEVVAIEPSFAVSFNVHSSVATLPILFFGTPEQKRRYLPRFATGEWIGAYALSEANAGTDAMAARTRAVRQEDGSYKLFGEKMWTTNGAFANLLTVFARIGEDKDLTAFLVNADNPGMTYGREEHKIGLKGSSTCRITFDGMRVGPEDVLGERGMGGKIALYTLNLGRFKIATGSLGQSKNLLAIATKYALNRHAFGRPISDFGLIQEKLASLAAEIFAAESMLYRTGAKLDTLFDGIDPMEEHALQKYLDASEELAAECAILKIFCTELLDHCADECLQIHGGYGYSEEYPAARAWRDARVNRIYEGTNEINRMNVAQILFRRMEKKRLKLDIQVADESSTEKLRVDIAALIMAVSEFTSSSDRDQILLAAVSQLATVQFASQSIAMRVEADDFRSPARREAAQHCVKLMSAILTDQYHFSARCIALHLGKRELMPGGDDSLVDIIPVIHQLADHVAGSQGYPI